MEYNRRIRNLRGRSEFSGIYRRGIIQRLECGARLNLRLRGAYKLVVRIKLASAYKSVNVAVLMIKRNHSSFDSVLLTGLL